VDTTTGTQNVTNNAFLEQVKWTEEGLVPAIAQDHESGRVLMMAWMNKESLLLSTQENIAVYWSRSRQSLWRKGESSGNTQRIKSIKLDCDGDTIVLEVEQLGGIACHTGRESCFYRELQSGTWTTTDPVLKDPKDIYS
jgi:phosphoribosyl-AMP cyclohydrolase